jgi:methionine synthase I (cobalamin-dependent)
MDLRHTPDSCTITAIIDPRQYNAAAQRQGHAPKATQRAGSGRFPADPLQSALLPWLRRGRGSGKECGLFLRWLTPRAREREPLRAMTDILHRMLETRDWLLADGATGTNLFARGLQSGDAPELWNLHEHEKLRAHYRDFIEAGSDIVLTNTFGGTANRLKLHDLDGQVHEVNRLGAALLCEEIAAEKARSGRDVVCAGSVGPTGDLFQPIGPLSHQDGVTAFAAQMQGLKDGGADLVWIETMSSVEEINAALAAADQVGIDAVMTMSFDTNGRSMMGVTPTQLGRLAHTCDHPPSGWGGNCGTGAPDLLIGLLSADAEITDDDMIICKANCGVPEWADGEIRYSGTEALMADYACLARDLGASVIGGCCGTTPAHVKAMRTALESRPRGPKPTPEQIIKTLGDVTGNTMELLTGEGPGGAGRPVRRRRRG